MQQINYKSRVALLFVIASLFIACDCFAFENPPPAPVDNGFKNVTEKKQNSDRKFLLKEKIEGDFDAYVVFDNANFNCPLGSMTLDGRKEPKYQDDYPMFETFEYSGQKIQCSNLYYPYNYRVPK